METQKTVNLLNSSENEFFKFATKKWYVNDSEVKGEYLLHNPTKFLIKSIESSFCNYSDACILVTGDIAVTEGNANTKVAFRNCAPFEKCSIENNGTLADEADFVNIAMIEYHDNYFDTS